MPQHPISERVDESIRIHQLNFHSLLTCHGAKKPCVILQSCLSGRQLELGSALSVFWDLSLEFASFIYPLKRIIRWHALPQHLSIKSKWPPLMVFISPKLKPLSRNNLDSDQIWPKMFILWASCLQSTCNGWEPFWGLLSKFPPFDR